MGRIATVSMRHPSPDARLLVATMIVVATVLAGGPAVDAQTAGDLPQAAGRLKSMRPWLDWGLPLVLIGSTAAIPSPDKCRWCSRDDLGRDALNGFDRSIRSSLLWDNTGTADKLSWVTAFAPVGLIVGVNRGHLRDMALPVLQAYGTTYFVTHIVKVAAGRERPVVHFGGRVSHGANASFFSGHSSGAFSLVFALARVNTARNDPNTKWIWMVGVPLAASTAYLRVAADKHYMTDVLTGAAVGATLGWWMPQWWGPSSASEASGARVVPALLPGGAELSFSWQW